MVVFISIKGNRVCIKGWVLIVSLVFVDFLEFLNLIFMLLLVVYYGYWIFGDVLC